MLTYNFSRTPIIIYARKDRPISPFRPKDLVGIPWQEQRQSLTVKLFLIMYFFAYVAVDAKDASAINEDLGEDEEN